MIKNIVFDIGNVLFGYLPKEDVKTFGTDVKKLEIANNVIVRDQNWREYLNGKMTLKDLLIYYKKNYGGYDIEFDILLKRAYQKYIIYEIERNTRVLKALKDKYNIYLLSNITKDTHEYMRVNYQFMKEVQGGVYSYVEHTSKPKIEFYEILLNRYNLVPEETVYIDDKIKNVEVAQNLNMIGIKCDLEDNLEKLLREKGITIEYTRDNS